MNKNSYLFTYLVIASLLTPVSASAYYISMDVGAAGNVSYFYPSVLGDEDKPEEKKEEKREEPKQEQKREEPRKEETKKEEKKEDKPARVEPRPEKIEIKKVENKTKVKLIKQDKTKQELEPEKVSVKFSAAPKVTPTRKPENPVDSADKVENETEKETEKENEMEKTVKDRAERKDEKVEVQSETHDDGTVEMQIESRNVKAKIKDSEIEVDVKNNSVGTTNQAGGDIKLIHLPDQALQKFVDRGLSTVPDTMEVGQSGDSFEYSIDATKKEKLFGIIPRETKYKLKMDDQNGTVTEQKVDSNLLDRLLNIFSF